MEESKKNEARRSGLLGLMFLLRFGLLFSSENEEKTKQNFFFFFFFHFFMFCFVHYFQFVLVFNFIFFFVCLVTVLLFLLASLSFNKKKLRIQPPPSKHILFFLPSSLFLSIPFFPSFFLSFLSPNITPPHPPKNLNNNPPQIPFTPPPFFFPPLPSLPLSLSPSLPLHLKRSNQRTNINNLHTIQPPLQISPHPPQKFLFPPLSLPPPHHSHHILHPPNSPR